MSPCEHKLPRIIGNAERDIPALEEISCDDCRRQVTLQLKSEIDAIRIHAEAMAELRAAYYFKCLMALNKLPKIEVIAHKVPRQCSECDDFLIGDKRKMTCSERCKKRRTRRLL